MCAVEKQTQALVT